MLLSSPQAHSDTVKPAWTQLSETVSQNKSFFLYVVCLRYFVTVMERSLIQFLFWKLSPLEPSEVDEFSFLPGAYERQLITKLHTSFA
jgi:hypothetical protein